MVVKNPEPGSKILFPSLLGCILEIFAVFITGYVIDNWKNSVFSHYTCGFSPPPPRALTAVLTLSGFLLAVYGTIVAFRQNRSRLKVAAVFLFIISLGGVCISWMIVGLSQTCLTF
jgi:hypothetical protein